MWSINRSWRLAAQALAVGPWASAPRAQFFLPTLLRQDLRHEDGDLLDVLDYARDVIRDVAQLLFPSVDIRTSTTNQDS